MKRNVLFATAVLSLAMTADLQSQVLPFKATEKTLPNGLKVIVVPTGFPNIVSLQIPVQTGSRNEFEEGKSGFAHFFEHMMFRGTAKYPDYDAETTKMGAFRNASSSNRASQSVRSSSACTDIREA